MSITKWCVVIFFAILSVSSPGTSKHTSKQLCFMATSKVVEMLKMEERIIEEMRSIINFTGSVPTDLDGNTIKKPDQTIKALEIYIDRFEKTQVFHRTIKQLAYHPIDAYYVMRDVAWGWDAIISAQKRDGEPISGLLDTLEAYRKEAQYPDMDDVRTVALSIARMQEFYNLKLEDMLKGIIVDPVTKKQFKAIRRLLAWDCVTFGNGALTLGLYGRAVDWFTAAKSLSRKGDITIPPLRIKRGLNFSSRMHDITLIQKGWRGPDWKTYRVPFDKDLAEKFRDRLELSEAEFTPRLYTYMDYPDMKEQQKLLCRGEELRPPQLKDDLKCRYVNNNHPYLRIGPYKVEELSKDIPMMMFHEFLHDVEMKKIIERATPKIVDAVYHYPYENGSVREETGKERIAKHWDYGVQTGRSRIPKLIKRAEAAFKLRFNAIEDIFMKTTNFGIGGQYEVHKEYRATDALHPYTAKRLQDIMDKDGDIVANVVVHFGEDVVGGATVFPNIGVAVWPTKGAALMWFNLDKNGSPQWGAYHAECPVLYGSKWTGIIRPLLYDQMFTYKCGSDLLDPHTVL